MIMKQEVAYGILQGLSDFWKCEELQDFTVTVDTTKFGCHRFLLAACSGFFRGLFRSGMTETELKCVTIEDTTSETFELILEALYTANDVLTNDNVIDIWETANQLQIPFLIRECEEFAKATLSLDNYIEYYKTAKLFDSIEVLDIVWSFILKNAISFFQTDFFLEMDISDVLKLIQSQDLETTSEDDVVHALLKWVEFTPRQDDDSEESNKEFVLKNSCQKIIRTGYTSFETTENQQQNKYITIDSHDESRKQHISDLLSNTRTCLLSTKCLEMLSFHPLVRENKVATDIIINAIFYQFQVHKRNGQWPPGAIYRKNSNNINAAVAVRKNTNKNMIQIKAFSFSTKQWLQLPGLYSNSSVAFVANDKSLYALSELIATDTFTFLRPNFPPKRQTLSFTNGVWSEVSFIFNLPPEPFVVSADSFIYILSAPSREVWQLDPIARESVQMSDLPFTASIYHATNYEQFIIAFHNEADKEHKVAVSCFDTSQNTWRRLDDLHGSAQGMISFKDIHSTYLVQTNGNLWMLELQSDDIKFKHVAKLWSCDWPLHGAVTFRDKLYIYGVRSEALKQEFQKQLFLDGIFKQIVYMESEDTESSSFIPVTLSRQCLVEI